MSNASLLQQIRSLSAALAQAQISDQETRAALIDLRRKISRAVEQPSDAPVADRLEEMAVRFEADHPAVGAALRQAIDALSRAGI